MEQKEKGKCIIFSAPSGAGKTTIVHALLKRMNELEFSISACSRPPRGDEKDQVDYYFLSATDFKQKIADEAFIEWQEVYTDSYYGTLKTEVDRIWKAGKIVLFDVDVYGGINLKKYFEKAALSFFVQPPSLDILEKRLRNRKTETEDKIRIRLKKAEEELKQRVFFDEIVVNNDLLLTVDEVEKIVKKFILS